MLSWGFYGALVVQVCKYDYMNYTARTVTHTNLLDLYYIAFPKDRMFIKTFVYGLFALETAQTIMISHDGIIFLGVEFANPAQLDPVRLSWLSIPLMGSISMQKHRMSVFEHADLNYSVYLCPAILRLENPYFVSLLVSCNHDCRGNFLLLLPFVL
jgi:hypothetical protein